MPQQRFDIQGRWTVMSAWTNKTNHNVGNDIQSLKTTSQVKRWFDRQDTVFKKKENWHPKIGVLEVLAKFCGWAREDDKWVATAVNVVATTTKVAVDAVKDTTTLAEPQQQETSNWMTIVRRQHSWIVSPLTATEVATRTVQMTINYGNENTRIRNDPCRQKQNVYDTKARICICSSQEWATPIVRYQNG
jgi:hypothetical protein